MKGAHNAIKKLVQDLPPIKMNSTLFWPVFSTYMIAVSLAQERIASKLAPLENFRLKQAHLFHSVQKKL